MGVRGVYMRVGRWTVDRGRRTYCAHVPRSLSLYYAVHQCCHVYAVHQRCYVYAVHQCCYVYAVDQCCYVYAVNNALTAVSVVRAEITKTDKTTERQTATENDRQIDTQTDRQR